MRTLSLSIAVAFGVLLVAFAATPAYADDCGGISCKCKDERGCGDGGDTGSGSDSGRSGVDIGSKDYRPSNLESLVYWIPIMAFECIYMPVGLLTATFDGGERLSRAFWIAVNYCPCVAIPRNMSVHPNSFRTGPDDIPY